MGFLKTEDVCAVCVTPTTTSSTTTYPMLIGITNLIRKQMHGSCGSIALGARRSIGRQHYAGPQPAPRRPRAWPPYHNHAAYHTARASVTRALSRGDAGLSSPGPEEVHRTTGCSSASAGVAWPISYPPLALPGLANLRRLAGLDGRGSPDRPVHHPLISGRTTALSGCRDAY